MNTQNYELYKAQFEKIIFLASLSDDIAYYGVQCGVQNMMDYVDMKCGAVPQGEFQNVIDINAAEQFLTLYTHIAQFRFATAVTQVTNLSPKVLPVLKEYLFKIGKENAVEKDSSIKDAFAKFDSIVLDGMIGENEKQITQQTDEKITWKNSVNTHKPFWEKAEGNFIIYNELLESFAKGLFSNTDFHFFIDKDDSYCMEKKGEK